MLTYLQDPSAVLVVEKSKLTGKGKESAAESRGSRNGGDGEKAGAGRS